MLPILSYFVFKVFFWESCDHLKRNISITFLYKSVAVFIQIEQLSDWSNRFLKNMTVIYAPDARETNCPDVYKTALMKPQ